MSLKISTKVSTALGDSSDAIAMFTTAVNNGQARLAMEILVDVINGMAQEILALRGSAPAPASAESGSQTTTGQEPAVKQRPAKKAASKASDSSDEEVE